jgi:hypothetical protein
MSKKAFEKIADGLTDAIAIEKKVGRPRHLSGLRAGQYRCVENSSPTPGVRYFFPSGWQ